MLGATVLLWYNESSAVKSQASLGAAWRALNSADSQGLVHITSMLSSPGRLEDNDFGFESVGPRLDRSVSRSRSKLVTCGDVKLIKLFVHPAPRSAILLFAAVQPRTG